MEKSDNFIQELISDHKLGCVLHEEEAKLLENEDCNLLSHMYPFGGIDLYVYCGLLGCPDPRRVIEKSSYVSRENRCVLQFP